MSDVSHQESVKPEDSASQTGKSSTSSTSSAKVRSMAKRAALAAQAAALHEKQALELEEFKLKQKRSKLELQTRLSVAIAEEEVFSQHGESMIAAADKDVSQQRRALTTEPSVAIDLEKGVYQLRQPSKLQPNGVSATDQDFSQHGEPLNYETTTNQTKEEDAHILQYLQESQRQQHQLLDVISLPQAEMMKFDGNPLRYHEFITCFDNMILRSSLDFGGKLMRLYHLCQGEAKNVIEGCMVMDPVEGFVRARQLLAERFGSSYRIGEAWITKVSGEGSLHANDYQGLQKFADDLRTCEQTLKALNLTQEIGSQRELVRIVDRLPYYLRNSWLKVVRITRQQGRSPNITDLVRFVTDAAIEVNDPVFGRHADAKDKSGSQTEMKLHRGPRSANVKGSFSSSTGGDEKAASKECVLCQEVHTLFGCEKFKELMPEQRLELARRKGLCFNCLKPGHMLRNCTLNRTCSVEGCGRKHTKFLHIPKKREDSSRVIETAVSQSETTAQNGSIQTESEASYGVAIGAGMRCVLPIVPVRVQAADGERYVRTYALLDSGSTTSFCTENLARKVSAQGKEHILSISTLDNPDGRIQTRVVSLMVDTGPMTDRVKLQKVFTKRKINILSDHMASMRDIEGWRHLEGLDLPFACGQEVGLLIGQDAPFALMPLEVRSGKGEDEPYAVRTVLGWSLHGPAAAIPDNKGCEMKAASNFVDGGCQLETQVERFWKLEALGAADIYQERRGMSVNDRKTLDIWNEGKCKEGEHYQLPIPFKEKRPSLTDNRWVAEQRLQSLRRKLGRDDALHCKYTEGIADLLKKGYAEEVEEQDCQPDDISCRWYLPHHPVIHAKKPGKVRIVFDCASKCKGKALNDTVLQGPDLTNNLMGVLIRFRQHPVALMADIEAMFHQVQVPRAERDVLRFLWWPSGNLTAEPKVYRMRVHLFGGTWSPSCCSFALRQTAEDHKAEYSLDVTEIVNRNFYVDDCLVSVDDEDQAIRIAAELRSLLKKGGFNLTKWLSNHPRVLESIPIDDRAKQAKGLDLNHDALPVDRALGLSWDVETDCFMYEINPKDKPLTRRGLLSMVSSIYDPLGFISPFILRAKMILQEVCRMKLGWDNPIPEAERQEWQEWTRELPEVGEVRVNRCNKPHDAGQVDYQLHNFSDASEKAYGAVSYLVMKDSEGKICCSLQMAKSLLAPLKKVTIPRLELMAATLATKLDSMIKQELDIIISKSTFWTDSTIVLRYIKNEERRFQTFVANRVALIRSRTDPEQWRYVDSTSNPADDASRGLSGRELETRERWLRGPEFLYLDSSEWPKDPTNIVNDDDDLEVKPIKKSVPAFSTESQDVDPTSKVLHHYSSWYRLKRAVCWLQRFVKWLQCKVQKHDKSEEILQGRLTVEEMRHAELKILQHEQRKAYSEEINALQAQRATDEEGDRRMGPKMVKKTSPLYRLDPKMEDGILRVGGRLSRSSLPQEAKHPIILGRGRHVTELILAEVHEVSGHSGRNHMMAILHRKYWSPGAGSLIRSIVSKCVMCRRQRGKVIEQKMADLPDDRLCPDDPPFVKVGVDYFGPIEVKRGHSMIKRYGVLFTCLTIRAVHIEMAYSLDTDSTIDAIRRFIARRGNVQELRSDNGTNLVGAQRELRAAIKNWNQAQIHDGLLQRNIKWVFNPPGGSHHGGIWERQIRTVRKLLFSLTRQQTLTDESLQTFFCEVEGIINGRPITKAPSDVNDVEALTPNHLLLLNAKPHLPPVITSDTDMYTRRRWRQVQYLADIFWTRWVREYLPQLQSRQKWITPRRNIQVNDLVLVVNEHSPRNVWPLGRVLQTWPDDKGFVRQCEVKTRTSVLRRPVTKLCLILEADS